MKLITERETIQWRLPFIIMNLESWETMHLPAAKRKSIASSLFRLRSMSPDTATTEEINAAIGSNHDIAETGGEDNWNLPCCDECGEKALIVVEMGGNCESRYSLDCPPLTVCFSCIFNAYNLFLRKR